MFGYTCYECLIDTEDRCLTTIYIGGLRGLVQIMRHYPNTLSPNTLFVKYPYMAYTPNRSVCQELFVYRRMAGPKGGESKQSLITKHSSKQTKCLANKSVWEKECLENKMFGVFLFSFKDPANTLSKHRIKK